MSDQKKSSSSHKDKDKEKPKRSHHHGRNSSVNTAAVAAAVDESSYAKRKSAADMVAKLQKDAPTFKTDATADLKALGAVSVSDDADPLISKPLVRASKALCDMYVEIRQYARDANVTLTVPEVVFVGASGSGKSLFMSAVMGVPEVTMPEPNARSVVVRMTNSEGKEKKITVQREVVSSGSVADELKKHNKANTEPINVTVESPDVLDAVFIDTPGLVIDPNHPDSASHEAATLAEIKPAHRLIVIVRPAWDATRPCTSFDYVRDTVKKVDPQFTRTIVVYTSLSQQIERIQSSREVNQFLSVTVPDVPTFFVTQPNSEQRAIISDNNAALDEKIRQAAKRDKDNLERLRYNKQFQGRIGVPAVVAYIANFILAAHQAQTPKIDLTLRSKASATNQAIEDMNKRSEAVKRSNYFRILASDYSMLYLKTLHGLLHGTIDGTPAVNGQSLEQEKTMCGIDSEWVDGTGCPVASTGEPFETPMQDNRIYGGQQFERLLSEFRLVAEHIPVPEISVDDITTGGGAGIPSLRNAPNSVWAASDLARQKTQEIFEPLVQQLGRRASYVLKRLSEIAESIIDEQRRGNGSDDSSDSLEDYTYFVHFVRDKFTTFIDATVESTVALCLDEFYSTRTVCWDVAESHIADDVEDGNVKALATAIFDNIRKRIIRNVLLKFYQNLIVPLDTELWESLQREVSNLTDDNLKQLFGADSVVQAIEDRKGDLTKQRDETLNKDKSFIDLASKFAHPPSA